MSQSRFDFKNTPAADLRPRFDYVVRAPGAPAVSIVTPFFNTGSQFHETARTVFGQSLQQWEWIIVNDGSTDPEALETLAQYRHRDPRVRVIDQENRGPGAARNVGFEAANAPLVLQLDSDDLLEPTAAEKWCWHLESHAGCGFVNSFSVGFGAREYHWDRGFDAGPGFLTRNLTVSTGVVRRDVHRAAGGYDESIRNGLEDWKFWLACANAGHWGRTVNEHLSWYRRRTDHLDRWQDWDDGSREGEFRAKLKAAFPSLWRDKFPRTPSNEPLPSDSVPDQLPFENPLRKSKPRILLLVPWYVVGGADKFNLDLTGELCARGWEVTIASTLTSKEPWLARFQSLTPDVFALHRFLRLRDYPRFLHYLIQSRGVDAVLITHSELGYRLLPYLRSRNPDVAFMDYLHAEEPTWKDGGYPTMSVRHREHLDLTVTSSEQLRKVVVNRGVEPDRASACYTNVDTALLRPDPAVRAEVRRELGVTDATPIALFAGRICAQKQPLVLADTFAQIARSVPGFVGLVAGNGPDMEMLRRRIGSRAAPGSVRLLGDLPPEGVRRLMMAADVLFLPSRYEGLALVLFEAMACGIPVVGADVGGQRELVTPECGVLIAPSDPETEVSMYSAILSDLLRQPARRAAMGAAARDRVVSSFRIGHMGTRMVEMVETAISLRQQQPRSLVSPALGLLHAELSVEVTRLETLAGHLWNAQASPETGVLGRRAHAILSRWFVPLHDFAVRRKWTWVPRAGMAARRLLLGAK